MKKLLQFIGLRSSCCNAAIIDWHFDRQYCADCEQWQGAHPMRRVLRPVAKTRAVH